MTQTAKKPNATDIYVGNRVRLARGMHHISQEKLGNALGITFQQIQKYEKGTNRIGASRLIAISKALKLPVSFFFEGLDDHETGQSSVDPDFMQIIQSRSGMRLLKTFSKANSEQRNLIADMAKTIVHRGTTEAAQ